MEFIEYVELIEQLEKFGKIGSSLTDKSFELTIRNFDNSFKNVSNILDVIKQTAGGSKVSSLDIKKGKFKLILKLKTNE